MSKALNYSDFQCLQDQLVDLKAKNYELAARNRRSEADFEAAKTKICSLQFKLEEQERDFQVISSTLRREIESLTGGKSTGASGQDDSSCQASNKENVNNSGEQNSSNDIDQKAKYKKLLTKAKELQQRYEKSVEIVQQLDGQNKQLAEKMRKIEEENGKLREDLLKASKDLESIKNEHEIKLSSALEEFKQSMNDEQEKQNVIIKSLESEREQLKCEVDNLNGQISKFDSRIDSQNEERKIQERKGVLILKELKRQLALEKNKSETLQKRLENVLNEQVNNCNNNNNNNNAVEQQSTTTTTAGGSNRQLSTSSSLNGNSNCSSSTNGNECASRTNQTADSNSVGSWSFVPNKNKANKSSNNALNETLSLCSIDSEDRETLQHLCDTYDVSSEQNLSLALERNNSDMISTSSSSNANNIIMQTQQSPLTQQLKAPLADAFDYKNSSLYPSNTAKNSGLLMEEEQAALVDRLTKLQHDKWMLEEKLSYMEQANSSLTEDLANKSDIIRHYFMDQAKKSLSSNHGIVPVTVSNLDHSNLTGSNLNRNSLEVSNNVGSREFNNNSSRRTSFPSGVVNLKNNLLSEKPSLKKVVDFLKDKSHQVSSSASSTLALGDNSETIVSKEAIKKMQLMLEETLIKCLKLQENLDFVTSELNKVKS